MATNKTQAVSYVRVSGAGQVDGDGPDRQRDAIAKFAKAHKIDVVQEYCDLGVSGASGPDDRPALGELLERLESNGIRTVLIEHADRLSRELMFQEIILDRCRRFEIRVVECSGGNELTVSDGEPTRVMVRQMLGVMAQFNKTVLVHRLRAARARIRTTKGRCEGRKAYGMNPEEVGAVARILELRKRPSRGGLLSFAKIAKQLNAENVPTRSGEEWSASTVRNIIARS